MNSMGVSSVAIRSVNTLPQLLQSARLTPNIDTVPHILVATQKSCNSARLERTTQRAIIRADKRLHLDQMFI
jgi:hypothetical protein